MFDVIEVEETRQFLEPMGTKQKFWYRTRAGERWLFKYSRESGGEHWAEKLAAYFCEQLVIPHADYELARWQGKLGVASRSFLKVVEEHESVYSNLGQGFSIENIENQEQLILGNQILGARDSTYAGNRSVHGNYRNSWHNIADVFDCLAAFGPPLGWKLPQDLETAKDTFLGYLLLDALIGNGDRHDENWGVVAPATGTQRSLAPTFDHASSLGRELRDEKRMQHMADGIAKYAERARSALYLMAGDKKPLNTADAFFEMGKLLPNARSVWLSQLENLAPDSIREGIDQVPSDCMSEEARAFAEAVLMYNRDRLLQQRVSL